MQQLQLLLRLLLRGLQGQLVQLDQASAQLVQLDQASACPGRLVPLMVVLPVTQTKCLGLLVVVGQMVASTLPGCYAALHLVLLFQILLLRKKRFRMLGKRVVWVSEGVC